MRYFVHDTGNRKVPIDISPINQLGKGATAVIYKVEFESEVVAAKVYHANKKVDEPKIRAMLCNKPDDIHISFAGVLYPQIAWPFATLEDENGVTAGYLMPLVDLNHSFSLDYYYDQVLFKKLNAPDEVAFSYKLEIAKNLSLIVAALHKNKHYFIDLKPQNIRVFRQTHIVSLVDCDGFSVADKKSKKNTRFPAELISTDYISPEAFRGKISPKSLGENQDRYALAVILFQLLNNGTHPFQGIITDDEGIATNDEKAAAGLYPHSVQFHPSIKPRPQSIHFLWDDKTRELFDKAFIGKLDERPSAEEWAKHFEKLLTEKSLVRCDKEPLNIAHMRFKGKECPSCYMDSLKLFKPNSNETKINVPAKNLVTPSIKSKDTQFYWIIFLIILLPIIIAIFNKSPQPQSELTSSISDDSDYPRRLVSEGWSHMDPNNGFHDYGKAYDLNAKGYNLGHPEGASNIGMLYEKGWGVDQNLVEAIKWYQLALKNHNHSAQAEIGLARIYLDKFDNQLTAQMYLSAAQKQLSESIYADQVENYRSEIILLQNKLDLMASNSKNKQRNNKSEILPNKKADKEDAIKLQLSKLNKDDFESITSACSQSTFAGKSSYDLCLHNNLKILSQHKSALNLDSLSEEQKRKVEINCSEDKFINGPAAYKKCISTQIKQLEIQ